MVAADLKTLCGSIIEATYDDHDQACVDIPGTRGPLAAKFLYELCRWIATSKTPLWKTPDGQGWVSYSRYQWVNDHQVWGKKFKMRPAAFERILKATRDIGAIRTRQWPTAYTGWKAALMTAPTEEYVRRRLRPICGRGAGRLLDTCRTVAGP